MEQNLNKIVEEVKKEKGTPVVSEVFEDGSVLETVYDQKEKKTSFALWQNHEWHKTDYLQGNDESLVPYSAKNNLIKHQIILFPSEPEEYESEEQLLREIQAFIHRYVEVSPLFEKVASYYVLFSWVYDNFNELPYLRLRGDPGCGKTRFLQVAGSICYKPIFASGASTTSPIFRILDAFQGTLIIDESDFRFSDEKAEVVKILNNGNVKGFPVLRSEISSHTKEFRPRAYIVFGPKIIATRGFFDDRALESRFLTEEMSQQLGRRDIPINLPAIYKEEALHIRNKLLLFRFQNLQRRVVNPQLVDWTIEPRLNQIFIPLLSIIDDQKAREDLQELARFYNKQMASERELTPEAQVLEIVRDFFASEERLPSLKDIVGWFNDRYGDDYDFNINSRWIGNLLRKKLRIQTYKSNGVMAIPFTEQPKLERLYERYGLNSTSGQTGPAPESPEPNANNSP